MLEIDYITDSLKGITHLINEDSTLIIETDNYSLFFIFDGVSMSENSQEGIRIAGSYIENNYVKYIHEKNVELSSLIRGVNRAIIESGWKDALTTYCCLLVRNNLEIWISHLGDSRIYTLQKDKIVLQTTDDVLFPGSSILTRCLGIDRLSSQDFYEKRIALLPERILICTDGFYEVMEPQQETFLKLLDLPDLKQAKSELFQLLQGQNRDDATYILVNMKRS
jgi:serine/threonine protein phosphatase PrpC